MNLTLFKQIQSNLRHRIMQLPVLTPTPNLPSPPVTINQTFWFFFLVKSWKIVEVSTRNVQSQMYCCLELWITTDLKGYLHLIARVCRLKSINEFPQVLILHFVECLFKCILRHGVAKWMIFMAFVLRVLPLLEN